MEDTVIEAIRNIWNGLDWSRLTDILITVIPALLCITFHELCHGLVAYKLGDNTAKNAGRLTLNPIKHIDILGLITMIFFRFGWAKPVPVNMANFKRPKTCMAITALAGPVSNLLLAAFIALVYGLVYTPLFESGAAGAVIIQMILTAVYLSCALAVFNIIPIPPLDGSKILFSLLPDNAYNKLMRFERFGFILLLILIYADVLSPFLSTATQAVYGVMTDIAQWSYELTI